MLPDFDENPITACSTSLDERPATISAPSPHGANNAKATMPPLSSNNDDDNAEVVPAPSPPPPPQEQLQRMSYFPPEDVWLESYGLFNGWPEDAEFRFTRNQAELVSNGFQPASRAVWKRRLRKAGAITQLAERLERVSQVALTEVEHIFDHTL